MAESHCSNTGRIHQMEILRALRFSAGELHRLGLPFLHLEVICAYCNGLCSLGKGTKNGIELNLQGEKSHLSLKAALTINWVTNHIS